MPFVRADAWAAGRSESRWERITVRGGEEGPLVVDAMTARVRAKQEGRVGPEERLVVIRPVGESQRLKATGEFPPRRARPSTS